jgi:hypothetical protein
VALGAVFLAALGVGFLAALVAGRVLKPGAAAADLSAGVGPESPAMVEIAAGERLHCVNTTSSKAG